MITTFDIKHNYEFYVWLKSNLPEGYHIQSEPSSAYYSEWKFCYKFYKGEQLIETIEGDFRELPTGALVNKAINLLETINYGVK